MVKDIVAGAHARVAFDSHGTEEHEWVVGRGVAHMYRIFRSTGHLPGKCTESCIVL